MITAFDGVYAFKVVSIFTLLDTFYPLVYGILRGFYPKKHLIRYSNWYFYSLVVVLKTAVVLMPLSMGVPMVLVMIMAFSVVLILQKIADDYPQYL